MFFVTFFALSLHVSDINNYPYLEKPVPRPEKKGLIVEPKITERPFSERINAYNRCRNEGRDDQECRHLIGPTYLFDFEFKQAH